MNNPTEDQIKWMQENYNKVRNSDIAEKYNITEKRVAEWFKFMGIKKKRVCTGRKKIEKEKRKIENRIIERLSPEYSNVTREQHVERILSMNI